MSSLPVESFAGYKSQTIEYKKTQKGHSILLDVLYPEEPSTTPTPVLVHYHGGFLVIGDRYAFLPHYMMHACARRGWIFVTPDYRLVPESTGHESLQDASDAWDWVHTKLPEVLGRPVGPAIIAGSSAGGFLAVNTALRTTHKPAGLLSVYGMLDLASPRYLEAGKSVFGGPAKDIDEVLKDFPMANKDDPREAVSAHHLTETWFADDRVGVIDALHSRAIFPDYLTGSSGLTQAIIEGGVQTVPEQHREIFPLTFGDLQKLPRTMAIHGLSDNVVLPENTKNLVTKLREVGIEVEEAYSEGGDHGFDLAGGDVDVETEAGDKVPAVDILRKVIAFFEKSVALAT